MAARQNTPLERLYAKTHQTESCWLWTGRRERDGYGRIMIGSRKHRPHRLSWELHCGSIPDGLRVCHKCDVRLCVRPDHLFLGTASDNAMDAAKKGRLSNGARNVTSCPSGHPYSPENTYIEPTRVVRSDGSIRQSTRRVCRQCRNRRNRDARRS
jgi:hypothetical protein